MKILILWPSGHVESKDNRPVVRRKVWDNYCEDMNRGDLFVYESTLRLLDCTEIEEVPISLSLITEELYNHYNQKFDFLILRGSNYIRNDGGLGAWKEFFNKIQIPILAFGIGAQASTTSEKINLDPDVIDSLRIIAEKTVHSIGVRGNHTAELLNEFGIKNVSVIGCPSIFRELNPKLKIDFNSTELKYINFTTHPYLGGLYTRNAELSRAAQVKLISQIYDCNYEIQYLTQGIAAETKIAYKTDIEAGVKELQKLGWFSTLDPTFTTRFVENSYCFETANEYYEYSANGQINIGVRLHGNITALAMGKPAIFVTYDSRTSELANYFGIPTLGESEILNGINFEDVIQNLNFDAFNSTFPINYARMENFLNSNGVKHLLTNGPQAQLPAVKSVL